VYFLTGRIPSERLPDFYGAGALPVDYPNDWDRRLGRTGYGIWIHGVPSDTYARAPRASDGCMALANEHMASLIAQAGNRRMPVVIADSLRWEPLAAVRRARDELLGAVERWRSDWESLDHSRYARNYSQGFHSDDHDRRSWLARKRRVNAAKRFIRVRLEQLSAFRYPGENDMAVVSFEQDYASSNLDSRVRKRQYWKREADGNWRIVFEGTVRTRPEHLRGIPYSSRSGIARATR
jgi:murein L,D-transpeptidase YafK